MIKGLGYLKYLKQSLIGFGISCFILLGGSFVNGVGVYTPVGINSVESPVDSNYSITPLKGGAFLSNYLGVGKSVLAFNENRLFWWTTNGYPYVYLAGGHGTTEGFFQSYYSCDLMTGVGGSSNCSETIIDYSGDSTFDKQVFTSFFKTVNQGQYVYLFSDDYSYVGATWNYSYNYINICWNSEELGKSFCFKGGQCGGGHQICNTFRPLVNSQNLQSQFQYGLKFGLLPSSWIGYAPGQVGYGGGGNIDGGSYTGDINQIDTGNVVNVSCSKRTALMWYRCNGYKTRMCYSSYGNVSDLYNGPGVSNAYDLTGVDIENVWFDSAWYRRNGQTGSSMSYSDWFDYWRKTYIVYKQNPQHTNPFLGVPVSIFTLMGNVDSYGLPYSNESILEFCDLSLYTADYSAQYDGVAKSAVCNMSSLDFLDCQVSNELNPDDGLPGDGYTNGTAGGIGNSWQGITNRSGYTNKPGYNNNTTGIVATGNDLNTIADGKTFENNFFSLLTESFKFPRSTGNGILPNYIILALCALVLFRFLSH